MLTLSPDGRRLRFVIGVAGPLWELAIDGSNSHPVITKHTAPVLPGTWSADGKLYFFLSWDDDRYDLWVVPDKQHWWEPKPEPVQLTFGPLSIASPIISKDEKKIYAIGMERRGELSVFDSGSGKWVRYLGGISASFLDFSRDGQWLAYVTYPQGTLWRSRIDGSEPRQLTAPPMAVINPRWSPDGKLIAFNDVSSTDRRDGEKVSIYAISRDGGSPLLLVSENENANGPDWSPDGTSIVYGAGVRRELRVFNIDTQISRKVPGSDGYWGPNWSPNGKYILAQSGVSPGRTVLYSLMNQQWEQLPRNVTWGRWSSDSRYFYGLDENSLVRLSISDRKLERIASLPPIPSTAYLYDRWGVGWFGVTPDGSVLTTRDVGREEICSFDLEYK
jgi:Tol biopolymer transport system component